jgi:hypothetical protein
LRARSGELACPAGYVAGVKEERKYFFFEKKEQKTFICFGFRRARDPGAIGKSFSFFFFKKEALPLLTNRSPQRS